MVDFEEIVKTGDYRKSLVALRDLLAHELSGNRCKSCMMSQLRTGDLAALALRLQKVMEELQGLPDENAEVTEVDRIRQGRDSGAPDNVHLLGSKGAQRRQGGRRTGG